MAGPAGEHCELVTADGLPADTVADADTAAVAPSEAAPFEEGCFLKFTVEGEQPEDMPRGKALKNVLGKTGGLAFVNYDPVRSPPRSCSRLHTDGMCVHTDCLACARHELAVVLLAPWVYPFQICCWEPLHKWACTSGGYKLPTLPHAVGNKSNWPDAF
jgi:hypothetical protein